MGECAVLVGECAVLVGEWAVLVGGWAVLVGEWAVNEYRQTWPRSSVILSALQTGLVFVSSWNICRSSCMK